MVVDVHKVFFFILLCAVLAPKNQRMQYFACAKFGVLIPKGVILELLWRL